MAWIFRKNWSLGRLPESELALTREDLERLRALGRRKKEYAESPVMDERRARWRAANDLRMTKPPIFVDEICWTEIDDPALKLQCGAPIRAGNWRTLLLKELYCLDHALYDQVAEPFIENPLVVYDSGFGIDEVVDTRSTQFNSEIVSRHFHVLLGGDGRHRKDPGAGSRPWTWSARSSTESCSLRSLKASFR